MTSRTPLILAGALLGCGFALGTRLGKKRAEGKPSKAGFPADVLRTLPEIIQAHAKEISDAVNLHRYRQLRTSTEAPGEKKIVHTMEIKGLGKGLSGTYPAQA